jgi:hypothetical protein
VPIAWPKDLGVNCRYGPGEEWEAVSSLLPETMTEIKGRTINTKWWYVSDPINFGEFCWVAYDVVETAGNLNVVPIVEPPMASVTEVTADVLVTFTACGNSNLVTFNGLITTNGPLTITYYWNVRGDQQETWPEETLEFTESGTQKIKADVFSADCGNYAVILRVTSPDEMSVEKAFVIQAP